MSIRKRQAAQSKKEKRPGPVDRWADWIMANQLIFDQIPESLRLG